MAATTSTPVSGLEPQPTFDFDGNPTQPATHGHVEASHVRIHADEDPVAVDLENGIAQSSSEDSLAQELEDARKRVIELETRLGLEPTRYNFAASGNPTHRPRDHSVNDMTLPIVPVESVLNEVEMEDIVKPNGTAASSTTKGNGSAGSTIPNSKVVSAMHAGAPDPFPPYFSKHAFRDYFRKWQGQHLDPLPTPSHWDTLQAFIVAWIGVAVPCLLHYNMLDAADKLQYLFIIASFGATAVLLYAAPMSDFSQPRNVFFGHTLSALIGVCVRHLVFPDPDQLQVVSDAAFLHRQWFACTLAVSLAIVVMNVTRTVHPPGLYAPIQPNGESLTAWQTHSFRCPCSSLLGCRWCDRTPVLLGFCSGA